MVFSPGSTVAIALIVSCALIDGRAQAPAPVSTLAVAGRTNANVSVAASGPVIAAVWSAALPTGVTDIYAAVSRDAGKSFGNPVRVNTTPGAARVNGEQPPRAAFGNRAGSPPELIVVWTSTGTAGGTLVSARSSDLGKTFAPTAVIAGADGPGNRGWENLTVDRGGNAHVVWLDHRELAQGGAMNHAAEHHVAPANSKKDAVATAQLSKLYATTLGDPKSTRAITGGVCYCCKTAIAAAGDNDLYLAWRHVYPQNIRDMAFTESHDGGRSFAAPIRVSEDQWQIEGCPEDGPALALDTKQQVHIVWPTLVKDTPSGPQSIGIFYAALTTSHAFTPRQRVPTDGVPHHPQIAVVRDTLFLAWDELKNGSRQVVLAKRTLTAGPTAKWSRDVLSGTAPGTYPSLVSTEAGIVAAWTSTGANSSIRVAPARF